MAYALATSYVGESLISGFNFESGRDLSNGFVSYKSQSDALDMGLYSIDPDTGVVRLGVDHTNKYSLDSGRPSVRLHSKAEYNHGLFIADFLHMPPSQCGVWPAFWAYGSPWPDGGEIDIIEGANMAYSNIISAHTADGCFLDPADSDMFTGNRRNLDCEIGSMNIGCGYDPPTSDASSYSDGFNAVNGGVYAMLWDSDYIRVWHFPRGKVPSDIAAKKPEPRGWGLPQALFGGSKCDVDKYFKNMNIVININFCGDYGAATWKNFDTCASYAETCVDYVANNPEAFKNAYWDVNYIDVYNFDKSSSPKPTAAPTDDDDEWTSTTTRTSTTTTTLTVTGSLDESGRFNPIATATPAPESNVPANPDKIGNYAYLGCFGSRTGFTTFDFKTESRDMTFETCIDACDGARYIGLFEGNCYCASRLDADTRPVATEGACDRACPGNPSEFCGGIAGATNATSLRFRRALPSTYLLTVYADLNANEAPAQPPPIGPPPTPTTTVALTSVVYVTGAGRTETVAGGVDITLTLDLECNCYKTGQAALPAAATDAAQSRADAVSQADAEGTVTVPVIPVAAGTTLTKALTVTDSRQLSEVAPAGIPQETGAADGVYQPQDVSQTIPSRPTTTRVFTYQPSPTKEPLYVTAGAWNGWKEVKSSAVMALAVAVGFALLL